MGKDGEYDKPGENYCISQTKLTTEECVARVTYNLNKISQHLANRQLTGLKRTNNNTNNAGTFLL